MVCLLADASKTCQGSWRGFPRSPASRPFTTRQVFLSRPAGHHGWKPSRSRHFAGTVRFLMNWYWRGCGCLPSRTTLAITRADAASGFLSEPVPLEDMDLTVVTPTRRIPVREHRAKGWKTRIVDHTTASLLNGATLSSDRVRY